MSERELLETVGITGIEADSVIEAMGGSLWEIPIGFYDRSTYFVSVGDLGTVEMSGLMDPTLFGEELVGGYGYDPYNSADDRLFMARLKAEVGPPIYEVAP